ncbi:hypothetical protein D3C79_935020 [compost metagenome]
MHKGDDRGEWAEQQELQRRVDHTPLHQGAVYQAVGAQDGPPGVDPNQVAGEPGQQDQVERCAAARTVDDVVGGRKTQDHRNHRGPQAVVQACQACSPEAGGSQRASVVVEIEGRIDHEGSRRPEAVQQ